MGLLRGRFPKLAESINDGIDTVRLYVDPLTSWSKLHQSQYALHTSSVHGGVVYCELVWCVTITQASTTSEFNPMVGLSAGCAKILSNQKMDVPSRLYPKGLASFLAKTPAAAVAIHQNATGELVQMKYGHLAVLLPARFFEHHVVQTYYAFTRLAISSKKLLVPLSSENNPLFINKAWIQRCGVCGEVYCSDCASRSIPVLDTTRLPFDFPPRAIPIAFFYLDPCLPRRVTTVCEDCYSRIHGCRLPTSSDLNLDMGEPVQIRAHRPVELTEPVTKRTPSTGLEAYPLRKSSAACKREGLGRWNPVTTPETPWKDLPLGPNRLRPYQVEIQRMEAEEEAAQGGRVVKSGEFQYRTPAVPRASTASLEYHWAWYKPLSDPGF
ncbi:hypothetical protein B0H11DRAFT_1924393 [Mycena galericulata]|nr:hypothetical protein B0H11DRAFT_1924393 [Mycena galericulata]